MAEASLVYILLQSFGSCAIDHEPIKGSLDAFAPDLRG
jgi:hypothetical protein